MRKSSWFRAKNARLGSTVVRRRAYAPVRLRVEQLEDRCVPATITVNSTADTAAPPTGTVTLRSAITQAEADTTADTIVFAPALTGQTITLTAALPTLTKGETITGLGADALTVSGASAFRVFNVTSTTLVTISALTITGGNFGSGGGVSDTGGVLTLDHVTVSGNTATAFGGGIFVTGATGNLTITNSTISSNKAAFGAGLFTDSGGTTTSIATSTITANTGTTGGFGAGILNEGTMTVTNCTIANNVGIGGYTGAGIENSGSLSLVGSTVLGNQSQGSGGGVESTATLLTITNSTIANNLSLGGVGGGGIRVDSGPLTLLNDTITNNNDASGAAASNAGGVSFAGTTFTTSNTIIALNFATAAGPPDVRGAVAGGSVNNFIGIGTAALTGILTGVAGNEIGTAAAPIDPMLGALRDNGGPTAFTRAPLPGSPVINTGNNAAAATLTTDQRGFLRVVTSTVDIGAVEFQPPLTTTALVLAPTTPTPLGLPVTLTATVTAAASSAGANNTLTGTVTFFDGTTVLGTATLDPDGDGTAVLTTTAANALPAGTDQITAEYNGDFNYGPSVSAAVAQMVDIRTTTAGIFDPNGDNWLLRNHNSAGAPDVPPFTYGGPGVLPVVGDWTGTGVFTVGVFTQATATFQIRTSNSPGAPTFTFSFGPAGDGIPVAGDWNGSGKWGVGVFDPSNGSWNLRNELSPGLPDAGSFLYGSPGSQPVVGDWTGSGKFTIGVIEPNGTWKLKNNNTTGPPDFTFTYGALGDIPITGDWDGNGTWTPGVVENIGGQFVWKLRNSNSPGAPDITPFDYGIPGQVPLVGSWVFPSLPEFAAGGVVPGSNVAPLSQGDLNTIVTAALGRLSSAGVDPAVVSKLSSVTVQVGNLSGGEIGESFPQNNLIVIDLTAAGHGWFVDPTPSQDLDFVNGQAIPGSAAAGKMDLLTVVLHEMGHMIGRSDNDGTDLMTSPLTPGTRYTDNLDAVFSSNFFGVYPSSPGVALMS